jgi:hypothetical protein
MDGPMVFKPHKNDRTNDRVEKKTGYNDDFNRKLSSVDPRDRCPAVSILCVSLISAAGMTVALFN